MWKKIVGIVTGKDIATFFHEKSIKKSKHTQHYFGIYRGDQYFSFRHYIKEPTSFTEVIEKNR